MLAVMKVNIKGIAGACHFATYARQRKGYREEMSQLRKAWQKDFELEKQRERQEQEAAKRKLVLEKAIRLRDRRKDSALRQEQMKQAREDAAARYRSHLARQQLLWDEKKAIRERQIRKFEADLNAEKQTWITADNIDSKITAELFKKQCTTGLIQKRSEDWRWHLITLDLKREMSPECIAEYSGNTLTDRLNLRGQLRVTKRMMVEDFLAPMVSTGQDRAKYNQIVKDFSEKFEEYQAFEPLSWYFDYLLEMNDADDDNRTNKESEEDIVEEIRRDVELNHDDDVESPVK